MVCHESFISISKQVGGSSLIPLIDSYADLIDGVASCLRSLTDLVTGNTRKQQPLASSYLLSDSLRAAYDRYAKCYSDAIGMYRFHDYFLSF